LNALFSQQYKKKFALFIDFAGWITMEHFVVANKPFFLYWRAFLLLVSPAPLHIIDRSAPCLLTPTTTSAKFRP
jgi:hypothetical protein